MIQSKQVLEWQTEARQEGRAKAEGMAELLLELLALQYGTVPPEVMAAIGATKDLARLRQWGVIVLHAAGLDEFRRQVQL